jgi:hypothetical protein
LTRKARKRLPTAPSPRLAGFDFPLQTTPSNTARLGSPIGAPRLDSCADRSAPLCGLDCSAPCTLAGGQTTPLHSAKRRRNPAASRNKTKRGCHASCKGHEPRQPRPLARNVMKGQGLTKLGRLVRAAAAGWDNGTVRSPGRRPTRGPTLHRTGPIERT